MVFSLYATRIDFVNLTPILSAHGQARPPL